MSFTLILDFPNRQPQHTVFSETNGNRITDVYFTVASLSIPTLSVLPYFPKILPTSANILLLSNRE